MVDERSFVQCVVDPRPSHILTTLRAPISETSLCSILNHGRHRPCREHSLGFALATRRTFSSAFSRLPLTDQRHHPPKISSIRCIILQKD